MIPPTNAIRHKAKMIVSDIFITEKHHLSSYDVFFNVNARSCRNTSLYEKYLAASTHFGDPLGDHEKYEALIAFFLLADCRFSGSDLVLRNLSISPISLRASNVFFIDVLKQTRLT